jgi:two-component system phosphate regulon sensor histidine kinase PhoR
MAQPRLPLRKLLSALAICALPGLAAIVALAAFKVLGPLWTVGAAIGCVLIAALFAVPVARDLTRLTRYGDELARRGTAGDAAFSGSATTTELAATMRRIVREAERRERQRHDGALTSRLAFDELPQPLLLLDRQRRVTAVNRGARDLVGSDPTGSDLAVAIRDPRVLETVDEALASKERRAVGFTVAAPVDRYFWAEIVPFDSTDTEGARVLVALYDLTERRRAERMRGDFIANASHELRTPLATLIGFIETLRGPARDDAEAQDKFLELMHEQASRMSRLVRDLMSLSTIEMNEHTPPETPVDVAAILGRVVATLDLEARKKDVKLVLEVPDAAAPIAGDDDQMTQLFQNLIDNAIKYGRKEGTVRIVAEESGEIPADLPRGTRERPVPKVVRVSVIDQGEGIAAEYIPRLTERFYRVDAARSRAVGGTGLGLAIVKHIVNRHRGVLQVESQQGVGSTFRVIFPVAV